MWGIWVPGVAATQGGASGGEAVILAAAVQLARLVAGVDAWARKNIQ